MVDDLVTRMTQIRAAAQEAVKGIPHFQIGEGLLSQIMSTVAADPLASMADRMSQAATLAKDAARAFVDNPANRFQAGHVDGEKARQAAWGFGLGHRGRFDALGRHIAEDRGANDSGLGGGNAAVKGEATLAASGGLNALNFSGNPYDPRLLDTPLGRMAFTAGEFGRSPMAKDGLSLNTFNNYLRPYDFTARQIHQGVQDTKGIFGRKEEMPNLNGPTGAALVRNAAIIRKEAPKDAGRIMGKFKRQWQMMKDDPKLKAADDDAARVYSNDNATDEQKNNAAAVMARAISGTYNASGVAGEAKSPSLSPTVRAAVGDEEARLVDAHVGLLVSSGRVSAKSGAVLSQKAKDELRLLQPEAREMATPGAAAKSTPTAPAFSASSVPGVPASSQAAPKLAAARGADLGLDQAAKNANAARADARQFAERTNGANASRDIKTADKDIKTADKDIKTADKDIKTADKDVKTAKKAASQDDFFASTGGDAPKAAALPAIKPMVVAKAEDGSKKGAPASSSPQIAENKPSTPARPVAALLKAKPNQLTV